MRNAYDVGEDAYLRTESVGLQMRRAWGLRYVSYAFSRLLQRHQLLWRDDGHGDVDQRCRRGVCARARSRPGPQWASVRVCLALSRPVFRGAPSRAPQTACFTRSRGVSRRAAEKTVGMKGRRAVEDAVGARVLVGLRARFCAKVKPRDGTLVAAGGGRRLHRVGATDVSPPVPSPRGWPTVLSNSCCPAGRPRLSRLRPPRHRARIQPEIAAAAASPMVRAGPCMVPAARLPVRRSPCHSTSDI